MNSRSREPRPRGGTLYVVATPLGNLEDLSPRASRVLRAVHRIACEDTRRTAGLLHRFGIETPTVSCHRFNEAERLDPLLADLAAGHDVALVSDGGTPAISDPGARLVDAALAAGHAVSPVPGPCAPIAVLSASGLPADRFVFDGFLPHRATERRRRLRELARESRTVVVLEAPHRIAGTLRDLAGILGSRTVVLARELTKIHEEILRATATDLADRLGEIEGRGEYTLAFAGAGDGAVPGDGGDAAELDRVRRSFRSALEREDGDRRRALRAAARELGIGRAELRRRLDEAGESDD